MFVHKVFIGKKKVENLKTWSRSTLIIIAFLGKTFCVHNGKSFTPVKVTSFMIGHKLGEFVPTRKQYLYKKKNRKW